MQQAIQDVEFARQYQPLTAQEREDLLAYGRQPPEKLGSRYEPAA